jgi:HTH-type transcriptional regulator/antitoxin MqsA
MHGMTLRSDMAANPCAACGDETGMARFENQCFTVKYDRLHENVAGLSGWRCKFCGEITFDPESAKRYAAAGDYLVQSLRRP